MIVTALIFFLILTILIFVHELGHFVVARAIGVAVEEFGFGLPPRIWGKKIKDTIYSVNWLPIGGFVKLVGEDDGEEFSLKGPRLARKGEAFRKLFWARSKKERAAILTAGVAMNFLVAVGITSYLLTQGVHEPSGKVHVEKVLPGSPAEAAGLQKGDIIKQVSVFPAPEPGSSIPKDWIPGSFQGTQGRNDNQVGIDITTPKDLITFTNSHRGEKITLTLLRETKQRYVTLVPRKDPPKGEGAMGVAISDLELRTYSAAEAPVAAIRINVSRGKEMLLSIGRMLWRLITFQPVGSEVAGPIGIAQVTGEAVKFGWKAVLEFMSILSLNLAVLNILPIPALDGGRLAFVFLEKLLGRRVKPAFEKSTHQIGMIILLFLVLLISLNDIMRLARGG